MEMQNVMKKECRAEQNIQTSGQMKNKSVWVVKTTAALGKQCFTALSGLKCLHSVTG